jgi:predicted phosphodiesterase
VRHARERGLDGIVCGHIHWPMIREIDGLIYANCGDWVDSCSAIVEHLDGRLELIVWDGDRAAATESEPVTTALAADVAAGETVL